MATSFGAATASAAASVTENVHKSSNNLPNRHFFLSSNSSKVPKLRFSSKVYSASPRTSMVQSTGPQGIVRKERGLSMSLRVRAGLDATEAVTEEVAEVVAVVGQVTEVNNDTFWPIVKAAGDKTVVVDMYTQWCGPCKIIAPKYKLLSEKYDDVIFLKLDCNQDNKPLAKELGIKVVPTFKILKDNKVVSEVTGAKLDELVRAIDTARST